MISTVRTLLLLCFALFWGGLTFYTGFAVRIAHDVLSDPMDGGLITQRVTVLLQYFAVATVILMLVNAIQVSREHRKLGFALAFCAIILGVAVCGLVIVHGHLDAVIDIEAIEIRDREVFTISHRRYNQFTTVEWIASLAYLPLTVAAWRKVDHTSLRAVDSQPG
jgi:hypothetical protein